MALVIRVFPAYNPYRSHICSRLSPSRIPRRVYKPVLVADNPHNPLHFHPPGLPTITSRMTTQAVASLQSEVNRPPHELRTLKAGNDSTLAAETLHVGQYLVERLVQLGITVRSCSMSYRYACS